MKKIFAFLVLLLLVACGAPKEQAPAAAPSEPVAAPSEPAAAASEQVVVEQSQVKVEGKPLPADATTEKVIQEEQQRIAAEVEHIQPLPQRNRTTVVGEMLNTYTNIDSYQFKTPKGTYYVRGDKVRFIPLKTINVRNFIRGDTKYPEIFVDEIIFDRTDKTATGYCFGFAEETRRECELLKIFDIPFSLSYNEYFIKTPDDWAKDYVSQSVGDEEHEKYFLNSIETTRVVFKDGTEMFFSPLAGVPIKVVKGPLESYTFDSLVINRVRPEDVIHRTRAQIPPNEVFYKPMY